MTRVHTDTGLADPGAVDECAVDGCAVDARLVVTRASFRLDVAFGIEAGEVVALLGPNGAGKTTTLRALAGLVALDEGELTVNGTRWDAPAERIFLTPRRRAVGLVFQDYLLFPHLSAVDNVAFGLRCAGASRRESRRRAMTWLDRMGLAALAAAKPNELSGGQAQRVALARALAVTPQLLLLDEPLAALDAATRQELRAGLRQLLPQAQATLLVTHDPLDAMMLADRIVVIEDGRIVQRGTASDITQYPRTDYVARLVGLNLYQARSRGHLATVTDTDTGTGTATDNAAVTQAGLAGVASDVTIATADTLHGESFVAFAPSAVAIYRERPQGSPRNAWLATVTGLERAGDRVRVRLSGPLTAAADVTSAAVADLRLTLGDQVWAVVKATETRAYPRTDAGASRAADRSPNIS